MGAAALFNAMKKKGLMVSDNKKLAGKQEKEAMSVTAQPAGILAKNPLIKKKKESNQTIREPGRFSFTSRITEARTPPNKDGVGPHKFKVVLIQEGMGNKKDAFYYPRESLEKAIASFEGKKIFSDHPDSIEDQARPERSVND